MASNLRCKAVQRLLCRCLSDLLLGQQPMYDVTPLKADRAAVQVQQQAETAAVS